MIAVATPLFRRNLALRTASVGDSIPEPSLPTDHEADEPALITTDRPEGEPMSQPLTALRQSVALLHQIAVDLPPDKIRGQAYPSEWTIADTFSHIGSGAVILSHQFEDALAGAASDPDFNQSVWDEWNAKAPEAQVNEAIEADLAFLQRLQRTDTEQRAAFHLAFGPFDLDFDGYVGLRLGEHALHTWDVGVVLDPSATLLPSSVDILIDALSRVAGFSGKPTGHEHTVHVSTSGPERRFTLAIGTDSLELTNSDLVVSPDLELPSEAFIRLVYGRLDAAHTPAVTGSPTLLDELRTAFPGF
jgi:uncharacterized protein (TIGR03083 family)